ncbi:MAG: VOC family protein [Polyangiales bacterium]
MKIPVTGAHPQILFEGECEDAIALYTQVLHARVENVVRYRDMPGGGPIAERAAWYAHAEVRIGDAMVMVADDVFAGRASPLPARAAGRGTVHLAFADADALREIFPRLAEGGRIVMAPHDTFWGAVYGALVDRFGVGWDLHHQKQG